MSKEGDDIVYGMNNQIKSKHQCRDCYFAEWDEENGGFEGYCREFESNIYYITNNFVIDCKAYLQRE